MMDELDRRILEEINRLSANSFVPAIKIHEKTKLDRTELGQRLVLLKKSGYVDLIRSEYVSNASLPNFIVKVRLADQGRRTLEE